MSYKIKGKKIIWTLKLTLSASLRNYYVQTNIWVGKIITTMMIDELLPINLAVLSLVNKKNFNRKLMIDSYKLETDETVEQKSITKPTKYDQTFLSIHQHYNTHGLYRNIILVVVYYTIYQWNKDPPPFF